MGQQNPYPLHMLIIDDDEDDRILLSRAVMAHLPNAVIETAGDGQAALGRLQAENASFHVIFLDLRMPNMNGIEFLEAFQALKKRSKASVIVWSEVDDERMKWAAFGLDAALFVEKAAALEGIEKILKDIDVLVDLPPLPQAKAVNG